MVGAPRIELTRIYLRSEQSKRSPARPAPPPPPTGTPPTGSRAPPSSPGPTRTPSAPAPPPSSYRFNAMRWHSATGQYDMGFRNHAPAPFPSETPAAEPTNGAP